MLADPAVKPMRAGRVIPSHQQLSSDPLQAPPPPFFPRPPAAEMKYSSGKSRTDGFSLSVYSRLIKQTQPWHKASQSTFDPTSYPPRGPSDLHSPACSPLSPIIRWHPVTVKKKMFMRPKHLCASFCENAHRTHVPATSCPFFNKCPHGSTSPR